ncbi:MAG: PAS domain-containing sensor histidine kinase [Thermobacillus sp. ZCTH02-B1]|uniref:cell wall metabolism sensor histidine kinase WalK n=1 Tax=Thermobacillus sp. ZCTH02-B1 TaxID=1858795 RepID=UPI000B56B3CB|nr:cell wall metabolism sensor histidine kinase WalK [Thermobacillus sp. ZCTH02-B1]OUM93689.1 MAG: PAS domain-containing sensor histidine kinase [Thermobacillus sp. ZCTH02-B1]
MKRIRFFHTIQVKLIIIYVLLILIAMQLIGVYFVSTTKNSLTRSFSDNLNDQVNMLTVLVEDVLTSDRTEAGEAAEAEVAEDLGNLVSSLFNISQAEIQVLDASGRVIATSEPERRDIIGRKNTTLAVSRALQGIRDNEEEIIDTDNIRKKVIARPAFDTSRGQSRVVGVVYVVASMEDLYATLRGINRIFVTGMLIALGLTGVLGVLLAHTITNPIKALTRQATAVAEGRFDERVPVYGNDEIGRLSEAFNYMTGRLQEALSANEEEKEKLASILANMSDGVVAADENGHVIVTNRRAREMLGVKNALGMPMDELLGIPKDRLNELQTGVEHSTIVTRPLADGGGEWLMRVTLTPIYRRDRSISGAIAVLHDVTEQEKLERARREFVANVSHELRTPLTTIKSYVEALEEGALEEPELAKRFVGVIRAESNRMIRLVNDLLHLSRLDSNQERLRPTEVNVREMLEEVSDRFSFQMKQKGIGGSVLIEDGIETAWFDRDQIDQVLDNLMSNAIKYTQDGGHIEISARKPTPDTVSISVKDNGMGIPEKDQARIFERFYRVDKARSRNMGGTGLGLSIAREIIKAHGGTIELESELGRGTTVTFTLPLRRGGDAG